MIGGDHVAAVRDWNGPQIVIEGFGINPAATLLIEPLELGAPQGEDAAKHKLADAVWMRLGVRQRQCRSPRAAKHLPALDLHMFAQTLEIGDQIPSRVLVERSV